MTPVCVYGGGGGGGETEIEREGGGGEEGEREGERDSTCVIMSRRVPHIFIGFIN